MDETSKVSGRGSYELYDSQRGSQGDNRPSQGMAPGCPGSPQDIQQMLEDMKQERAEWKKQEKILLQTISKLQGTPQNFVNSGSYGDGPCLTDEAASGNPSAELLGENVKDAQIKHLQRQVTILQANLYKAEGWNSRVEEVNKDRDKALDDLRSVSKNLETALNDKELLKQDNNYLRSRCLEVQQTFEKPYQELKVQYEAANEERLKLQQDFNALSVHYTDLQQRHEQTLRDLKVESRHERCQAQTARLQEELNMAKTQIQTLKESVGRLSNENQALREKEKEQAQPAAVQGQGSVPAGSSAACNQELEYLHKVVDQLKNTVLEQRNFLMTIKTQSGTGSLPLTSRTERAMGQGPSSALREQFFPMSRSIGAGLPLSGSEVAVRPQQPLDSQDRMSASAGSLTLASQLSGQRVILQPGPVVNGAVSKSTLEQNNIAVTSGAPVSPLATSHTQQLAAIGLPHVTVANGGAIEKKPNPLRAQMSAPLRRLSQSQVMARRANSDAIVMDKHRPKTDVVLQKTDEQSAKPKVYPQWVTYGQQVSPNVVGESSVYVATVPSQLSVSGQVAMFEAAEMPLVSPAQYELTDSGGMRMAAPPPTRPQNPPQSPAHLLQQQQRQQLFHNAESVRVINNDMMGGGLMLQNIDSQSAQVTQRGGHEGSPRSPASSVIVQSSQSQSPVFAPSGVGVESSSVDPPHTPQLNADRVCPVCSRNYDELSMEEFQTHVFECFDDENSPETMKPIDDSGADRLCPMCNTKFGKDTSQTEFEKHVHSHFGEDGPGNGFEVLYQ